MTFSGGVLPAFAIPADPVATEFMIPVEETADAIEPNRIENTTPTAVESSSSAEDVVESSPEPIVEELEETAPATESEREAESSRETAKIDEESEPKVESVERGSEELDFAPLALGPDGAPAPYAHWNVVDEDGKPVAGATFRFDTYTPGFLGWGELGVEPEA